jgi:hypothetical protein
VVRDYLVAAHREYPDYDVVIQGHSYGAGVISIAALEFVYQTIPIPIRQVHVYGYGGPRAGNAVFADVVNRSPFRAVQRIVLGTDLVPHLPFGGRVGHVIFGKFLHYRGELWLHPTLRQWVQCDAPGPYVPGSPEESPHCANSIPFRQRTRRAHLQYWNQKPQTACAPIVGPTRQLFLPEDFDGTDQE